MSLPRKPDEIEDRLQSQVIATRDMFGIERCRLLDALKFERAKKHLTGDHGHTLDSWESENRIKDVEDAKRRIADYLPTAWSKANIRRGNEVLRAIAHFRGLIWLMGDEHSEALRYVEDPDSFKCYGKPVLVRVSDLVGYDWRSADDDEWAHVEEEGEHVGRVTLMTASQAMGL